MRSVVRIDFHCHSSFSDGSLEPELLVKELSQASVKFAALTDHNTISGQESFRNAASQHGIGTVTGVEITCYHNEKEVHILGYGVDLENKNLIDTLIALRSTSGVATAYSAPQRRLDVKEAVTLIHNASGVAALAHPTTTFEVKDSFDTIIKSFKAYGLDGIEVYRDDLTSERIDWLHAIAEKYDLLETAGSDFHRLTLNGEILVPGIDIETSVWKRFRDAVLQRSANDKKRVSLPGHHAPVPITKRGIHWRFFATQIVVPALITIALFAGVFFFFLLPTVERALMDRKREMIRELTRAAVSLCADAHSDAIQGVLSEDSARYNAKQRVRAMRYGRDGKDYFWIQDTTPSMIMHPYKPELEGSNLGNFRTHDGTAIFVQFARYLKDHDAGYMHYVWQWKDDSTRIEPKESYISLFKPWGWIIGTGVYVHDVKSELQSIIVKITVITILIVLVIFVLLLYILRASLRIEKERTHTENQLIETTERYKTLVNAATEALVFFSRMRCRYGNPLAVELLGYSLTELELLDIHDIFPEAPENKELYAALNGRHDDHGGFYIHSIVKRRDDTVVECSAQVRQADEKNSESILISLQQVAPGKVAAGEHRNSVLKQLLMLPQTIGNDLRAEIITAPSPENIKLLCESTPSVTESLLDNGAYAPDISQMLTSVADAVMRRLIELGIEMLGVPPSSFAFLALGSQGRMEQTLLTDQDNAIIYTLDAVAEENTVKEYFLKLADFVCGEMSNCGYRNCNANVMASNPQWCMSQAQWRERFESWILKPEMHEVMEFSIFFDFRVVYGEDGLARDLREFVLAKVQETPRFLTQAAHNALQFKSPMRLFGFIVGAKPGDSSQIIDLKVSGLPIVSFARLYSLQQAVGQISTLHRLEMLARKGVLLPSKLDEITTAFALLLRLRMRHQVASLKSGADLDNVIKRGQLGHIEEAVLKECFNEIDYLQSMIRRDFFGD